MTKYLNVENNTNYDKIKEASYVIKDGGLVIFPTETVYGIGANGLDSDAVKNIFTAKGRNPENPLILHIAEKDMLKDIVLEITEVQEKLIDSFWPGPLTIIFKKKDIVPDVVTAGQNSVAVRMPSNKVALELIKNANVPIAAPSANKSGKPSGTRIEDIQEELFEKVQYVIDDGKCNIGVESTVVKIDGDSVYILRPGKITKEDIEKVIGKGHVIIDEHVMNKVEKNEKVLSPGMKFKHYSPNSKCILLYSSDNNKMVEEINNISAKYINPVIVCSNENADKYSNTTLKVGSMFDLSEIASNIFETLRKVDSYMPDIVIIEGVKEEGIGLAIMNRLIRAAEYNYIKI